MKNLFEAGKLLLLDMASTLFFLVLYLLTANIPFSVVLGMALGVAQIGWQLLRNKPIDTMPCPSTASLSKAVLFLIGYVTMRTIGLRRRRARMVPALP